MPLHDHEAILHWVSHNKELLLNATGIGIAGYRILRPLRSRMAEHQEMKGIWHQHFSEFLDEDTQSVVGTRGGRSRFCEEGAARCIVPSFRSVLNQCLPGIHAQRVVADLQASRDCNLILHGGSEPSELAERSLSYRGIRYDFGLKAPDGTVTFRPSAADRQQVLDARAKGNAAGFDRAYGEWVIVDKQDETVLVEPKRHDQLTYYLDGAILMKVRSPANPSKSLLAFMGAREVGTYLSNVFVETPRFARLLDAKLRQNGINRESFQAIVQFNLRPYEFGRLPGRRVIHAADVVAIHNLG